MVEQGSGEVRTWSVLLPSDNSGTPYILMPVNRKHWEQQQGNLSEHADTRTVISNNERYLRRCS